MGTGVSLDDAPVRSCLRLGMESGYRRRLFGLSLLPCAEVGRPSLCLDQEGGMWRLKP